MLPFDYINYRTQFYWPAALEAISPEPVDEYSGKSMSVINIQAEVNVYTKPIRPSCVCVAMVFRY